MSLSSLSCFAMAELPFTAEQISGSGIATAKFEAKEQSNADIKLSGRVSLAPESVKSVTLPASVRVTSIAKSNLTLVKQGELVLKVQSAQWLEKQSEFLKADADLIAANQMLERDKALLAGGLVAKRRFDVSQSQYNAVRASWQAAREQLKLLGASEHTINQVARSGRPTMELSLYAPSAGQVNRLSAQIGQEIEGGQSVFQVVDPKALLLELSAPIQQAAHIEAGNLASVPLCGGVGKVVAVGLQVDDQNQSIPVKVALNQQALGCLKANQVVTATIQSTNADAVGTYDIPQGSVITQDKRHYVFVRSAGGFTPLEVNLIGSTASSIIVSLTDTTPQVASPLEIATTGTVMLKGAMAGLGGE